MVVSPIPLIGVITWSLVILGMILSFAGLSRANKGLAGNRGLAVTGIVLSAMASSFASSGLPRSAKSSPTPRTRPPTTSCSRGRAARHRGPAAAAKHTVVYKVTETATTTSQESDAKLPWEKTIELPRGQALQVVSVLAQGSGSGSIKVTIVVDGKVFKEATAEGYGIASANGNIGDLGNG